MFLRILRDSCFRQKRRKAVVLAAVALGTAAAAALGDIALDVGDKMNRELKAFGANLVVVPQGGSAPAVVGGEDVSRLRAPAWLSEADILRAKDNFWKNNILALAPVLDLPVRIGGRTVVLRGTWFERAVKPDPGSSDPPFVTGIRTLNPYWHIEGRWPDESESMGRRAGGEVTPAAGTETASVMGMPKTGDQQQARTESGSDSREPRRQVPEAGVKAAQPTAPGANAGGVAMLAVRTEDHPGSAAMPEVVVGRDLARALGLSAGSQVDIALAAGSVRASVAGIVSTGDESDGVVFATIEAVRSASGLADRVSRIQVSALTTPESAVYQRLGTDPRSLPPAEFEKWTCTPFVSSIAYELERAIPGAEARVVRRIADTEGRILGRTSSLMVLIAILAAFGAALTVTSALTTSVLERRGEIGLLKAMGAGAPRVVGLFLAEAGILGIAGGILGAGAGALMARWISIAVFGAPVAIRPLSLPLAVAAALAITTLGCILPARRIMTFRPFEVLRGL